MAEKTKFGSRQETSKEIFKILEMKEHELGKEFATRFPPIVQNLEVHNFEKWCSEEFGKKGVYIISDEAGTLLERDFARASLIAKLFGYENGLLFPLLHEASHKELGHYGLFQEEVPRRLEKKLEEEADINTLNKLYNPADDLSSTIAIFALTDSMSILMLKEPLEPADFSRFASDAEEVLEYRGIKSYLGKDVFNIICAKGVEKFRVLVDAVAGTLQGELKEAKRRA